MTTYVRPKHRTRSSKLKPEWHVIDAENKTLGRLSSEIATLLQGKHRPIYVPYMNTGAFVVVVNAEKIRVTGDKLNQKMYYRHSGYHGGLKEKNLARLLETAPTLALKHAVKGMLPKNSVGRQMLSRLKLYVGESHPHEAQLNAGRSAERAELARQIHSESDATPLESHNKPDRKPTAKLKAAATTKTATTTKPGDDVTSIKLAKSRKSRTETKPRPTKTRMTKSQATKTATEATQPVEEA